MGLSLRVWGVKMGHRSQKSMGASKDLRNNTRNNNTLNHWEIQKKQHFISQCPHPRRIYIFKTVPDRYVCKFIMFTLGFEPHRETATSWPIPTNKATRGTEGWKNLPLSSPSTALRSCGFVPALLTTVSFCSRFGNCNLLIFKTNLSLKKFLNFYLDVIINVSFRIIKYFPLRARTVLWFFLLVSSFWYRPISRGYWGEIFQHLRSDLTFRNWFN